MKSWVPLLSVTDSIICPFLASTGEPSGMTTFSLATRMVLGAGDQSRRTSRMTASR